MATVEALASGASRDEEIYRLEDYTSQKEATLFVIDASPSMTERTMSEGHGRSCLQYALDSCYHFLTKKIITSPHDMVGVMLYGTASSEFPEDYGYTACKNVTLLVDLACPDAKTIKMLKDSLPDDGYPENKSMTKPPLTNILFFVNGIFSQRAPNYNYKRVILFTNEDDPHAGDKAASKAAVTRAKDLSDLGIRIEPVFFRMSQSPFNVDLFWDEIIYRDEGVIDEELIFSAADGKKLKKLLDTMQSKAQAKRALFSIPFRITDDIEISIKGYGPYKQQAISKNTWIDNRGAHPQIAKPVSTFVCADTTRTLDKSDFTKGYKFGSEIVQFSEDECAVLKRIEAPVLRIIGYKKQGYVQMWHSMRPAYFIYPTEDAVIGSTRVFACLHKTMLQKRCHALAWFIPRKNASPSIVAIVAQTQCLSASEPERQVNPAGLHLITLPFADDIRRNPILKDVGAPTDLINAMSEVIQSLRLNDYDPHKFANPALRWHWRTLQAMALSEDMPQPEADETLPKYKGILKRAKPTIQKWHALLQDATTDKLQATPSTNKRANTSTSNSAHKSLKTAKSSHPGREELLDMKRGGRLAKCSVAQLQGYINEFSEDKGKPASKRKADLISYLEEVL